MQMCQILKNVEKRTSEIIPPSLPKTSSPPKHSEPIKTKASQVFPGTFSIKDMTTSQEKATESKELHAEDKTGEYGRSDIFSLEQLETAWDEFAESLHNSMPHLSATLKKHRPVLKEDFLIEFCVDNKVLAEDLTQKRNDLLEFLIARLKNAMIHLQIIVPDHPIGVRPYTDREKFGRMAEKNPELLDLREQLDLEIES
jgi:DNA polymerase-3 subunit gamma/tau